MVLVYYLANIIFGLLLMMPMYYLLNRFAGDTLMMQKLGGRMDMDFFFEFLIKNPTAISQFTGLLLVVPLGYWLFGLFLSGGAYSVILTGEKYSPSIFWGCAAKYFGRFLRLFIWSIPVFAILYCVQFIELGIERLIWGIDPYQYIVFWGAWTRVGIGYLGILVYYLVLDYARIQVITTDEKKMRKALWRGIKFTFRNIITTFSITFLLFISGIIILVIYNPAADSLHAASVVILLLLFFVKQIYMVFRMTLKLTLYASQASLYNSLTHKENISEMTIQNA